jgi:hypothetical protein
MSTHYRAIEAMALSIALADSAAGKQTGSAAAEQPAQAPSTGVVPGDRTDDQGFPTTF